ncbi:MAG: ferritin-like domain-containing protein [Bdellovibrionales bacterium]|nr:ferritin-like domain-containing protein [Bdellovibrionales bacterium]
MNNDANPDLGLNRTGTKMSPVDSVKTTQGAKDLTNPTPGDCSAIAENRILYIKEADGLGSIPLPTTLRGAAEALQEQVMMGNHAMMDKLGERLAFERSGTRLYEALITKYHSSDHKERLPELARMEQFYLEELKHFQLVAEVITKIGGDPTSLTPAADISGIAAAGWFQVVTDPRTTFLQSLEIILQAELVDNAGWELLIELAERNGMGELAIQFQQSLDEESFHLLTVKQWVQELTLNDEIISPEQNYVEFDMDSLIKH